MADIPESLARLIDEPFTAYAKSDLSERRTYSDGYILLGKNGVIVARAKADNRLTRFKGADGEDAPITDWEISRYAPTALEVSKTVTGGVLLAELNGTQHALLHFTNHKLGDMVRICEDFKRMHSSEDAANTPPPPPKRDEEDFRCPKCGRAYPDPDRKVCPHCMDKRSVFFRTLRYFKPHRGKVVVMVLCYLVTALLNLVWPYLNGELLYDNVLAKNEAFLTVLNLPAGRFLTALALIVLTMALSKLTMQAAGILQGVLTAKIVPEVVRDLKSDVFKSMGELSINFFNARETGSLMTRVTGDADRVSSFYFDGLPYFIINVCTIIATATVMFSKNAGLAAASLFLLPILFFILFKMMPRLWHFFGKLHRAERSLNSQIHDNITGARVVKSFGRQKDEIKRFDKYNRRRKQAEMSLVSYDNRIFALNTVTRSIGALIVWGLGSYMILSGRAGFELGLLITFVGYVDQLNGPLDSVTRIFRQWAESMNAAQRMFEIIDAEPDVRERHNPVQLDTVHGDIELRNVTFGYEPHRPVLKDISLKIEGGKMFGIVGRSGAGKSTLVNLISRLYDPDSGEIYLDGVNIKSLSFEQLRKNVAMVSQETYIFIGTVAENIAYANPDATREEIVRAAVLASAHDFICKMPDGYDTIIGSSGRSLSGGERQRISIARAILANPRILILDEATASVDTETEKAIQASINLLIKGRTTISIAHRLSTLRDASCLAVIDDGELTELGTHTELLEKHGTYYKLRELQTKALAMKGLE